MNVEQIYTLVNDTTKEILGDSVILQQDLSNVVDVGTAIFNANAYDKYVQALVNRIGRTIFVERKYTGGSPDIRMDSWEWGSVMQKIRGELPDAVKNESWDLQDGASYDDNVFVKPVVSAKFFNSKTSFEVRFSLTDLQVKQSFSSPTELNSFVSMLWNEVEKKMTIAFDGLIDSTIGNFIGETFYDAFPGGTYNGVTAIRCRNLLYEYNTNVNGGTPLTTSNCLYDKEFLRYASAQMGLLITRLKKVSRLFNIGQTAKFTPAEYLHVVMLADFVKQTSTYLESDTFHNELVALPKYEEVAYWQGSGTGYGEADKVSVTTASGHAITASGILCVMFDHEALGVTNYNRRTTSKYNAPAEFTNYWNKQDASYFNDLDENFVVFYIA